MMRGTITDDQARHLAAFVALIQPTWQIPGIRAAISKARHRAPAHELAHALIRLAMRADVKTPALLAEDGPHWSGTKVADDTRFERCPAPGHSSYPAWNCGACKTDRLPAPDPTPTLGISPEQAARNAEWAARARAAMQTPPTRELDAQERAASERQEER